MYVLRHYTLPFMLAVLLHAAAVWALYQGFSPEQAAKAFAKPPPTVMADLIVLQPKAKPKPPPPQPKPQPQPAPAQTKPEPKPAVDKAKQEEAARKKAEELAAKKKAEEAARKAAEEAERLKRLSELANTSFDQAIAEESADLQAGTEDMVAQSFMNGIQLEVIANWSRPPSARNGMKATLLMELIPTGSVVSVTVVESSGNAAFDRSAEQAVRRAGKFEVPSEMAIFERHFRKVYLLFQPEDLLR